LSFLGRHEGRKEGCQGKMYQEGRMSRKEGCQGRKDVKKGRMSRKEGCISKFFLPHFLLLSVASFFISTSLHFNFPSFLL
jgi:hypothetical protein